jgi:uncharacterized protein (DUF433 family)
MSTHVTIVKTPDTLGGKPRIEGVRVGVLQVGDLVREHGMSIDTAAGELRLSREQVEAAVQYYDDHPSEMETLRAQREATIQQLRDQSRAPDA